jgi:hypothetical protein
MSALRLARLAMVAGCALALVRCGDTGRYGTGPSGGGGGVAGAPAVTILLPATPLVPVGIGDSILVQFQATDDKGVVSVDIQGVVARGNPAFGTDTLVDRFTKRTLTLATIPDTTMARFLYPIKTDSTSETVLVIVTATDSSGNKGSDTVSVRVTQGPRISVDRPSTGVVSSVGKSVTIQVTAVDPQGVRVVGWRTSGVLARQDSIILSGSTLPDTVVFTDTLVIPAATAAGNLTITGFGVDSIGDPSGTTPGVTVTVVSAASDVTPPLVSFTVDSRVEVDDSIFVHATDASGGIRLGFIVRQVGSATIVAADSLTFGGNQTEVTGRLRLKLDTVSTFPRLLTVEAFALDSVGNRGLSTFSTTPTPATGVASKDTITVVAGKTFALPAGGQVGDAIYNRNRNELYLTNLLLNRLEVFDVGTSTFVAGGIPVGSRPLGLSLWPRDTLGNYADTVIVANSGGTNLSVVDVKNRVERRRHQLPNYEIDKVSIVAVDTLTGQVSTKVTWFDYSDRPQYVATTCRNNCTNIIAVYSTTPTGAQSQSNRAYMAWEDLTASAAAPLGHFFWEIGATSGGSDTLQVIAIRDTAPGFPRRDILLGAAVGQTADFGNLVVQDTTFVRNSGDFNHAVMGEGGGASLAFARAFAFDARPGLFAIFGTGCFGSLRATVIAAALQCTGLQDGGVSNGVYVSDFVINRASRVTSVATNFNGRTNFVRADSIYVMDFTLRQTGLIQVGRQNAGMDVNPNNNFDARTRGSNGFGGNGNVNNRLLYTARPDANIEVFDSYWFGSVATIPLRDPIIGPVRLALNGAGVQVLVGVTANGVVVVPLTTAIVNPFPVRAQVRTTR